MPPSNKKGKGKKSTAAARKHAQTDVSSSDTDSNYGSDSSRSPSPPPRGRGRPKGSVSKKKLLRPKQVTARSVSPPVRKPVRSSTSKSSISKKKPVAAKKAPLKKLQKHVPESDSYSDSDSDRDSYPVNRHNEEEEYHSSVRQQQQQQQEYLQQQQDLYDKSQDEDYQGAGFRLPTKPAIFTMTGQPKSGKSYMMKYIMFLYCQMGYFSGGGLVFTPTKFNGDYNFLPDRAVIPRYSGEHLEAHIENLRRLTETGRAENGADWSLKPNFVILDDCLGLLKESEWFNNWISTYRHTNTSIFIMSQYLASRQSVNTLLRNCTTFALMWPSISKNNLQAMYNAYGGVFENEEEFKRELLKCKNVKHTCLLYKALQPSKDETYCTLLAGDIPKDFQMVY